MLMRENMTNFSFEVKWVEGKTHMIADALSRAPVFQPEEDGNEAIDKAIRCLQTTESNELADIAEAIDDKYNSILQAVKSDANFKLLPSHHPARQLLSISTQLAQHERGDQKGNRRMPILPRRQSSPGKTYPKQSVAIRFPMPHAPRSFNLHGDTYIVLVDRYLG